MCGLPTFCFEPERCMFPLAARRAVTWMMQNQHIISTAHLTKRSRHNSLACREIPLCQLTKEWNADTEKFATCPRRDALVAFVAQASKDCQRQIAKRRTTRVTKTMYTVLSGAEERFAEERPGWDFTEI